MTPEIIHSRQNERIKRLVRLRERKHRRTEGVTLLDELRLVSRALAAGLTVNEIYACPESLSRHDEAAALIARAEAAGAQVFEITSQVLDKVAYRRHPEGLVAVATPPRWRLKDLALPTDPLVIVLEDVEKPGNLGAVARTASGVGAAAVLASGVGADPWNPNCLRASTGAVFTVPTIAATRDEIVAWLRGHGMALIAASVDGDASYTELDLGGATALVLGAEDRGLSDALLSICDQRCRIPMVGAADSLNVSVSAAILAYEALRQRSIYP